ncbi:MAG: vitamin K epoxide reductase family protein [Blastopirellula sp. JB062]
MAKPLYGYPAESAELEVRVKPYSYNPSAWSQRLPICILAFLAFLIATHMGMYQWRILDEVWDPVFGDQSKKVLDSEVAKTMHLWFGIPDAILGAVAYLGDAIFGLAGSTRRWQYRPWMVILFGIDVIPLGLVSAILVVLQATIVGNWCFLCLVTAVISLILVVMAFDEVRVSLTYLVRVWKKSKSRKIVWRTLWGFPERVADEVAIEMVSEISPPRPSNVATK